MVDWLQEVAVKAKFTEGGLIYHIAVANPNEVRLALYGQAELVWKYFPRIDWNNHADESRQIQALAVEGSRDAASMPGDRTFN